MVDDASIEVRIGPNKTLVSAPFDLSMLTGGCNASPTTGLIVVGEPTIDGNTESGIFVWQNENDTWSFRLYAGAGTAITAGSIASSSGFISSIGINLESSDVVDTSNPTSIEYDLRVGAGAFDGIDFTVPSNADLCLMVDNASIDVRIGPNKTLVSAPFDLSTLTSGCDTNTDGGSSNDPAIDGEPNINPAVDEGVFVWRQNGVWHLRTTTFTSRFDVQGRVQSYDGPLIDVDDVSLEQNNSADFLELEGDNRFRFRMITGGGNEDEITFVVNDTGESCFNIKSPRPISVYLGPNRTPVSFNFDLTSLGPCSRGS